MANPRKPGRDVTPPERPDSPPPPDLYPTSDIRFVMVEIGKLTSTVDHLGATVDKLGGKVDKLSHQATWVKGGLAVGLVLITIVVGVGSWLVNSNFVAILQALRGLQH